MLKPLMLGAGLMFVAAACGSNSGTNSNTGPQCPNGVATSITFAAFAPLHNPNSCSAQMYAKYGSAGFSAANANIIARALNPNTPGIGTTFQTRLADANTTRQTQFTGNLASFLIAAYGGPNNYTGPAINTAHADLSITAAQYTAFIDNVVVPGLTSVGVDPNDVSNCFAPVVLDPNFVSQVVTCN